MASSPIDQIDERILDALERDGRLSIRQVADAVHISRANAHARIKRMTDKGIITGFTAMVDPVARGFDTSAFITAKVLQAQWRSIRERLRRLPGIAHIALVGGEFDVVMLVRARDNADLRKLVLDDILNIDGVLSTHTLLIFDEPSVHR